MARFDGEIEELKKIVEHYPILDNSILIQYFKDRDSGNFDKEKEEAIVGSNLRLVLSVALDFYNKTPNTKASLSDFFQEGIEGVYKAMQLFKVERGNKFSTFAYRYIENAIRDKYVYTNSSLSFSNRGAMERIAEYKKAKARKAEELDRIPTIHEVASSLKILDSTALSIERYLSSNLNIEDFYQDENMTILDAIADENCDSPETEALKNELLCKIKGIIKDLPLKEKVVISLHLGLGPDRNPKSFTEISHLFSKNDELKCSITWVETLYYRALNKVQKELGLLEKPRAYFDYSNLTLNQILSFSDEEINLIINTLPLEEQLLLKEYFGENLNDKFKVYQLDDYKQIELVSIIEKIRFLLKGGKQIDKIKSLKERLNMDDEQMFSLIYSLNTKNIKYLLCYFGGSFYNKYINEDMPLNEKEKARDVILRLRSRTFDKKPFIRQKILSQSNLLMNK